MNETIKTILSRRSVRKYKIEQFPQTDLDLIVEAGLYAPSARNTQAWHLTVIRSPEAIAELTAQVKAATLRMPVNHYKEMVSQAGYAVGFGAPTFIIVSVDPAESRAPEADAALVLGNMFLAAHSLGLDSCWINQLGIISDEPGFRAYIDKLGVPAGYRIYGCATLGYAEKRPERAPARREGTVNVIE